MTTISTPTQTDIDNTYTTTTDTTHSINHRLNTLSDLIDTCMKNGIVPTATTLPDMLELECALFRQANPAPRYS